LVGDDVEVWVGQASYQKMDTKVVDDILEGLKIE